MSSQPPSHDALQDELSHALASLIAQRVASGEMRIVALTGMGGLKPIRDWLAEFGIEDLETAAVAVIRLKEEK